MNLELQPLLEYGVADVPALFNNSFSGYVVPVAMDLSGFMRMVAQDGVDASSSRVVLRDGEAVGVALLVRRGWSSRLAAAGIVPAARGTGVGKWMMQQLIAEARERGERRILLEVIEQNTAGVRLYSGCGFRVLRRLVSYTGTGTANAAANLEEVDIREVARMVTCHGLPDLPWQISGESLAQIAPPNKAYRLDAAYAIISNPEAPRVAIRAVLVEPHARRRGQATRLLKAIMAKHAGKQWDVPAHCPEEIGGVFERVGLTRGSLAQLQMINEWS